MIQLHDSSLIVLDFFGNIFVSFGFCNHIFLNIFLIIHVQFGNLLQLLLFLSDFGC